MDSRSSYYMAFHNAIELLEGGYYERMVGSMKRTLQKTIGRRILMLEKYQTLLCEAECIINMRPLT